MNNTNKLGKEDQLEFHYRNLERIIDWIKAADTKANLFLVVDVVIVGFIVSHIGEFLKVVGNLKCLFVWVISIIGVLTILCILASLWYLYRTVYPRVKSRKYSEGTIQSLTFWESIAEMSADEYMSLTGNLDFTAVVRELQTQSHIISRIANQKFRNVRMGYNLSLSGVLLFVVFLVLLKTGGN